MDIKISKIELKFGKEKLSLTLDEARKFQEVLNNMFGQAIVYRYPYYYPNWTYLSTGVSTSTFSIDSSSGIVSTEVKGV